jgi:hypothetical protein
VDARVGAAQVFVEVADAVAVHVLTGIGGVVEVQAVGGFIGVVDAVAVSNSKVECSMTSRIF